MKAIRIENLVYRYDAEAVKPALDSVTFDIEQGEFITIVGHNGSGKSTLAKHLNALFLPALGKVSVFGMDTADENSVLKIRERVGMVFQNPDNQIVTTVVEEDVAFGPENLGIPAEEIRIRVAEALSAVGMEKHAKSAPHMLSGGQKQRVAIAGTLAMRPSVLVLDEATSMLDPAGQREIMNIVLDLNKNEGLTVVAITQNMDEVIISDRVVVMSEGRLEMLDTPRRVFAQSKRLQGLGLDVPAVVGLRNSLIAYGMKPTVEITHEGIADHIASVFNNGGDLQCL